MYSRVEMQVPSSAEQTQDLTEVHSIKAQELMAMAQDARVAAVFALPPEIRKGVVAVLAADTAAELMAMALSIRVATVCQLPADMRKAALAEMTAADVAEVYSTKAKELMAMDESLRLDTMDTASMVWMSKYELLWMMIHDRWEPEIYNEVRGRQNIDEHPAGQ